MNLSKFKTLGTRYLPNNKFMLAGVTVAATAIVGSAGVAAAQHGPGNDEPSNPRIVAECKEHYKQFGFKNVGQCVSFFEHHHHGYGGHGYGGDQDHDHDKHHHHHHHNDGDKDKDGDHDNDDSGKGKHD